MPAMYTAIQMICHFIDTRGKTVYAKGTIKQPSTQEIKQALIKIRNGELPLKIDLKQAIVADECNLLIYNEEIKKKIIDLILRGIQ